MVKYREILRLRAMGGEPGQHRPFVRVRALDGAGGGEAGASYRVGVALALGNGRRRNHEPPVSQSGIAHGKAPDRPREGGRRAYEEGRDAENSRHSFQRTPAQQDAYEVWG